MNLTYILIDLKRQLRDVGNLTFIILMPVVMYLVFGVSTQGGDLQAGNGNVQFYVLTSMASYGAALAATQVAGAAGVEQMQGWGRQVGLTPARNYAVVAMKVVVALIITTVAIGAIYAVGFFTGAKADSPLIWAQTFAITLGGSSLYALFGYAIALRFKSESALGVATGILVLMSFVGNVFMPLSGKMLDFAHFTPLYGWVGLVRWPLLEGVLVDSSGTGSMEADELWMLLLNVGAWAVIFAILAVSAVRKGRSRQ